MPFWKTPKAAPLMSLAARLLIATAGVALLAYANVPTDAGAAKKTLKECKQDRTDCRSRCRRVFETKDRIDACYNRCSDTYMLCRPYGTDPNRPGLEQTPGDPLTKPQPKPPTGGLLDTTPSFRAPKPSGTGKVAPN